jgi:hypothetical protein
MSQLVFTTSDGSVTFKAILSYGTGAYPVPRQHVIETITGKRIATSVGVTVRRGELILKGVSVADKNALFSFIESKLNFSEKSFTISAVQNADLGKGLGMPVTGVQLIDVDLSSFIMEPPASYAGTLKYQFRSV